MTLPRRLTDVDAAGHRELPGAFTALAAERKRDRIKAYAVAFAAQAPLPYGDGPDDDEPEADP